MESTINIMESRIQNPESKTVLVALHGATEDCFMFAVVTFRVEILIVLKLIQ